MKKSEISSQNDFTIVYNSYLGVDPNTNLHYYKIVYTVVKERLGLSLNTELPVFYNSKNRVYDYKKINSCKSMQELLDLFGGDLNVCDIQANSK